MKIDMANQDKFAANFDALKQGKALLPDIDPDHVTESLKQAISDLEDHEVQTLIELCKKTKSHLFLKDHVTGAIVQGL